MTPARAPVAHRVGALADLATFLRFPSVSSDPRHASDVRRCADWLVTYLSRVGFRNTRILETAGHPAVFASWREAPGRPTVLIYGHYDVQPAGPNQAWSNPPFEPTIARGRIWARGSADDKGPLFAHIAAVRGLFRSGRLPVNTVFLFDGEEEVGSPNLRRLLRTHRAELRADVAVISDTRMAAPGRPAIIYSARGHLAFELEVRGRAGERHSGAFGGAVPDPARAICQFVGGLQDPHGCVTLPGFYDDVRHVSSKERAYLRRHAPAVGPDRAAGELGFTPFERTTIRPALIISGLTGGHPGPGFKGVVPASATVRFGFRLIPNQSPQRIEAAVRTRAARTFPPGISATLRTHQAVAPALVPVDHPAIRAARQALTRAFGTPAVLLPTGGTVPAVNLFRDELGIPTVLMGFATDDDNVHAPDEGWRLSHFGRGTAAAAHFLQLLGDRP